jgi:hypothetical protein
VSAYHFTLYSRSYCHLCDDLLQALKAFDPAAGTAAAFPIDVIDVDADPALVELYDELVPVLMGSRNGGPPERLCHYFLDEAKVREFLAD